MPPSLFDAYVADAARAFYPSHFGVPDERRRAVLSAVRPLAPEVARALGAQNALLGASRGRDANLRALAEGAAAVVTGQQVGIFLGPLYTIYKAASAVVAARVLAQETGARVVPVFWLQTEDHDLVEIASAQLARGADAARELRVPADADNKISIAHCVLPQEIEACMQTLSQELGSLPHAAPHLERMARCYRPGAPPAAAFARVLAELFADEGLVFLDPRDPALATVGAGVHRRALSEHALLGKALLAQSAALQRAGYAETVHVRADATLSFFHAQGATAGRARLRATSDGFVDPESGRSYTLAQLLEALERDPLCFSTSALLRPILQDTLLPTAAYVGGPAEVAYFAQIAPLYAAYGMRMPLVVPRARMRIVDEKARRLLARLGIDAGQCAQSEDALLAALCARDAVVVPAAELQHTLDARLSATLSEVLGTLGDLHPEVVASVERTRATLRSSVEKLAHKYEKSLLHRDQVRVADVRRLQSLLYPQGKPQERCHGVSYYAARYGERAFISQVLASIEPFDATPRELTP